MDIRFSRRSLIILTILVATQASLWIGFLAQTARQSAGPILIINDAIAIAVGITALVFTCRTTSSLPYIVVSIVSTLSLLMVDFSFVYWSRGATINFNVHLTHLDAIYFTLGTVTTVGTGNIVATSDAVREIQSLQMTLDLALVVFAIGLVIARFSASSGEGRWPASPPPPQQVPTLLARVKGVALRLPNPSPGSAESSVEEDHSQGSADAPATEAPRQRHELPPA